MKITVILEGNYQKCLFSYSYELTPFSVVILFWYVNCMTWCTHFTILICATSTTSLHDQVCYTIQLRSTLNWNIVKQTYIIRRGIAWRTRWCQYNCNNYVTKFIQISCQKKTNHHWNLSSLSAYVNMYNLFLLFLKWKLRRLKYIS